MSAARSGPSSATIRYEVWDDTGLRLGTPTLSDVLPECRWSRALGRNPRVYRIDRVVTLLPDDPCEKGSLLDGADLSPETLERVREWQATHPEELAEDERLFHEAMEAMNETGSQSLPPDLMELGEGMCGRTGRLRDERDRYRDEAVDAHARLAAVLAIRPEDHATKSRDYGRGFAEAIRLVREAVGKGSGR